MLQTINRFVGMCSQPPPEHDALWGNTATADDNGKNLGAEELLAAGRAVGMKENSVNKSQIKYGRRYICYRINTKEIVRDST